MVENLTREFERLAGVTVEGEKAGDVGIGDSLLCVVDDELGCGQLVSVVEDAPETR